MSKPWVALWKSDLLSSLNYQALTVFEKGIYIILFTLCRDDEYVGQFCYPNGNPMTIDQIIDSMDIKRGDRRDRIKNVIEEFLHSGLLFWNNNKALEIRKYAEKTQRIIRSSHEVGAKLAQSIHNLSTEKPTHNNTTQNNTTQNNKEEDIYTPVFDHWNLAGLLTHKKLTDKMKRSINGRIAEGYTVTDIVSAITTYSMVVNDKTGLYWWSHKNWSLDLFLQRGFERFRNREFALESFLKNKEDKERLHRAKATKEAEKMILTKPCPYCKGAGLDINAKPTAKEITPEAAKKIPATMMDRLVKDDGKYYTLGLPVCPQCKGAKRVPKGEGVICQKK